MDRAGGFGRKKDSRSAGGKKRRPERLLI